MMQQEGRARATIKNVHPKIDADCFPVKHMAGAAVVALEADILADGQISLAAWIDIFQSWHVATSKKIQVG